MLLPRCLHYIAARELKVSTCAFKYVSRAERVIESKSRSEQGLRCASCATRYGVACITVSVATPVV